MSKLIVLIVAMLTCSGGFAKDYYIVTLKCYKHESFSFNLKNERNAMVFDIPVEKEFYDSVKIGQCINESKVYSSCVSIIPRLFESLKVQISHKRIINKPDFKN